MSKIVKNEATSLEETQKKCEYYQKLTWDFRKKCEDDLRETCKRAKRKLSTLKECVEEAESNFGEIERLGCSQSLFKAEDFEAVEYYINIAEIERLIVDMDEFNNVLAEGVETVRNLVTSYLDKSEINLKNEKNEK